MLPFIAGAVVGTVLVGAYSVLKNKEAREAVKNKFAEAVNSCKKYCDPCESDSSQAQSFEYKMEPGEHSSKEEAIEPKKATSTKKKASVKKEPTNDKVSAKIQKPQKYTDRLEEIRSLHKEGKPAVRIAIILKEKYGILVTNSTISKYIRNCKKDGLL